MKVKDRILTLKQIKEVLGNDVELGVRARQVLALQYEVAFKAGERKIIEWLERYKKIRVPKYQLKEWGIE